MRHISTLITISTGVAYSLGIEFGERFPIFFVGIVVCPDLKIPTSSNGTEDIVGDVQIRRY